MVGYIYICLYPKIDECKEQIHEQIIYQQKWKSTFRHREKLLIVSYKINLLESANPKMSIN